MSVRLGLLALLADGPAYGYQLKKRFEQNTGGAWKLNVGQVYTTLDRLERDGCVQVALDQRSGTGEQRSYSLTEPGRDELEAWFGARVGSTAPPRDELQVKVLLAIAHRADAQAVIAAQRAALLSDLQGLRRRQRQGEGEALARALVTAALVLRIEADLRWLDECDRRTADDRQAKGGTR